MNRPHFYLWESLAGQKSEINPNECCDALISKIVLVFANSIVKFRRVAIA